MMENFNNNINPRQLRINGRCPTCNAMYDFQKMQVLGEKDQSLLVFLECPACTTSVISILSFDPRGLSAKGMITDLTADEFLELESGEPVTSDQVLEIHELLDNDRPVDNFIN